MARPRNVVRIYIRREDIGIRGGIERWPGEILDSSRPTHQRPTLYAAGGGSAPNSRSLIAKPLKCNPMKQAQFCLPLALRAEGLPLSQPAVVADCINTMAQNHDWCQSPGMARSSARYVLLREEASRRRPNRCGSTLLSSLCHFPLGKQGRWNGECLRYTRPYASGPTVLCESPGCFQDRDILAGSAGGTDGHPVASARIPPPQLRNPFRHRHSTPFDPAYQ